MFYGLVFDDGLIYIVSLLLDSLLDINGYWFSNFFGCYCGLVSVV